MNWLADDLYELIRPILIAEERREEREARLGLLRFQEERGHSCLKEERSLHLPD